MIYILDLDGTLIDSTARHHILMKDILLKKQSMQAIPANTVENHFSEVEFMEYKAKGNSGKKYLTDVLHLQEDLAKEIMVEWGKQIESRDMLAQDCLYEDTIPFLKYLKANHEKIYFVTARQEKAFVLEQVNQLQISSYAEQIFVVSTNNAAQEKKQVVAELMEASPEEEFIVVGDTENEYKLGQELHIKTFLLNRGFRGKEYWDNQGITSISSLGEITIAKK